MSRTAPSTILHYVIFYIPIKTHSSTLSHFFDHSGCKYSKDLACKIVVHHLWNCNRSKSRGRGAGGKIKDNTRDGGER